MFDEMPMSKIISTYNELADQHGAAHVTKFRDRQTAIRRLQNMMSGVAEAAEAGDAAEAVEAVSEAVEAVSEAVEAVSEAVEAVSEAVEAVSEAVEAVSIPASGSPKGKAKNKKMQIKAERQKAKEELLQKKIADRAARQERPRAASPDKKESSGKGRVSVFAGKFIFAVKGKNPRLAGSLGWHSMNIIYREPGVTYEKYIAEGGRWRDLNYDVMHGNAILSDSIDRTDANTVEAQEIPDASEGQE
jgi:uncharacterized protein YoxC